VFPENICVPGLVMAHLVYGMVT